MNTRIKHFHTYDDASTFASDFNKGLIAAPFVAVVKDRDASVYFSNRIDSSVNTIYSEQLVLGKALVGLSRAKKEIDK